MAGDALFDLARSQAMPRHVDDIVGTAEDEIVAIAVAYAPVKRGIDRRLEVRPIGFNKTIVIPIHSLYATRRQRSFNDHNALFIGAADLAGGFIHDMHLVTVHGYARTAQTGRLVVDALGNRENRPAAFGLPVIVDHWHAQRIGDPC